MTHLEVKTEERGKIRILHLKGFLDAHNHQIFRTSMNEMRSDGLAKVVVNFEQLTYIGSSGIEVILANVQAMRDKGGDIVLCGMSQKVFKVFDLLGLPSFFRIFDTVDEAAAFFGDA